MVVVDSIYVNDCYLFIIVVEVIVDNEYVCKIVWNSNGIDIVCLVNIYRINIDKEGIYLKWDVCVVDGIVEKYGFKYFYELVGYYKGNNEILESVYVVLKGFVICF